MNVLAAAGLRVLDWIGGWGEGVFCKLSHWTKQPNDGVQWTRQPVGSAWQTDDMRTGGVINVHPAQHLATRLQFATSDLPTSIHQRQAHARSLPEPVHGPWARGHALPQLSLSTSLTMLCIELFALVLALHASNFDASPIYQIAFFLLHREICA